MHECAEEIDSVGSPRHSLQISLSDPLGPGALRLCVLLSGCATAETLVLSLHVYFMPLMQALNRESYLAEVGESA